MKELWRTRPPVGNGLGHRTTTDIAYGNYVIPAGSTVRPNIWYSASPPTINLAALTVVGYRAIGQDPIRHPDPEVFRPERWEGDTLSVCLKVCNPKKDMKLNFLSPSNLVTCLTTPRETILPLVWVAGCVSNDCLTPSIPFISIRECSCILSVGKTNQTYMIGPGQQVADRSFATAIMRILWALEIKVRPGTKLPVVPEDYMEPQLPGVPGSKLPVCLSVRKERKSLINKAWEKEQQEWKVYVSRQWIYLPVLTTKKANIPMQGSMDADI